MYEAVLATVKARQLQLGKGIAMMAPRADVALYEGRMYHPLI